MFHTRLAHSLEYSQVSAAPLADNKQHSKRFLGGCLDRGIWAPYKPYAMDYLQTMLQVPLGHRCGCTSLPTIQSQFQCGHCRNVGAAILVSSTTNIIVAQAPSLLLCSISGRVIKSFDVASTQRLPRPLSLTKVRRRRTKVAKKIGIMIELSCWKTVS